MDDVCSLASAQILKIRTMEILLARKNHIAQNQSKTIKNKKKSEDENEKHAKHTETQFQFGHEANIHRAIAIRQALPFFLPGDNFLSWSRNITRYFNY